MHTSAMVKLDRIRVLVVEDEPLIRLLALDVLESAGCDVVGVATAQDAVAAVQTECFDAAVTDLGLPDSRGAGLVRRLAELRPRLGLVICTGRQPDDPMVTEARAAGADQVVAVLGKPFTDETLIGAVRAAAARFANTEATCC